MQFFIEPNEFDGRMAVGELIIKLPAHQEALLLGRDDPQPQVNLFLIISFVTICFIIKMFELIDNYPEELNLMGRFLDELYGYSENDLYVENLFVDTRPDAFTIKPPIVPYEDKYEDAFSKLVCNELTQEDLTRLTNNVVMEYTPVGNVIMSYNSEKGSFEYYSDSIVPYRYLNVVGRKYACVYNCATLMKRRSKAVESIVINEATTIKELESEPRTRAGEGDGETKKSVFAKFKTYNKGASNASMQAGADQSVKRSRIDPDKVVETNRYTSCGKIANMQMLKKVDRKQVDKTYAMSFAEYKQKMTEAKCS